MNSKNSKKTVVFTLIFGLLAGNNALAMDNTIKYGAAYTNGISALRALVLGCYTPRYTHHYYILNIVTGLDNLRTAYRVGNLNHLAYGNAHIAKLTPLALNICAYALGVLIRPDMKKEDANLFADIGISPQTGVILSLISGGIVSAFLTWVFEVVHTTIRTDIDNDLHKYLKKPDVIKTAPQILHYGLTQDPQRIFNAPFFINAIESLDKSQLDTTFDMALEVYQKNPLTSYENLLIETFIKTITHFTTPSPQQLKLLIHFFEQFQTTDCDSSHYDGLPLLLPACNRPVTLSEEMIATKYMNALVHDVIKYFIETGMPLYKKHFTNQDNIAYAHHNPIMQNYLKMVGRYNKTLLLDTENLGTFIQKLDPEQQSDIFCIAASRGHINTINLLTKLHPKKYSLAQAAHLCLFRNLKKPLIKYYSISSHLFTHFGKVITNQSHVSLIKKIKSTIDVRSSRALDTILGTTEDNEAEKNLIILRTKDMLLRAHPTKFAKMIEELRHHQTVWEYETMCSRLSTLKNIQ